MCMCCRCLKPNKKSKRPSKFKDYCSRITLFSALFCVCCGFLGGLRANNVFSDAIALIIGGVDAVVLDASDFTQEFPEQIRIVASSVRIAVKSSLELTPTYLDNSQIATTLNAPAGRIVAALGPANTAYETLVSNAPEIDSIIADIHGKISALNTVLSNIQSQISAVNAVNNGQGAVTFQLTAPLVDSTSSEQTALATVDTAVTACTNANSFANQMTTSGVSGQSEFFTASNAVVSKWTDINAAINSVLLGRADLVYANVIPTVDSFLNPTVTASRLTANQMNASVAGLQAMITSVMGDNGLKGYDKTRNGMFPLLWVVILGLIVALVICCLFKWPKILIFLFLVTPFFVMVILLLAAVLFLLAVAFGDICDIFVNQDASPLAGLSPSIANSTTNFFAARQKDCLDSDLGYVKLATDMGLVSDTSGNFTDIAAPTINGLDFSVLGNLYTVDVIPANSQIIQIDTISGPGTSLQSNICVLSASAISSSSVNSLAQTIQSLLDDINTHSGSSTTPPASEFTLTSGSSLAYTDLASFSTLLTSLKTSVTTWQNSLVAINADVSQLTNLYSQFSTSASTLSTPLPGTMAADYTTITTALAAYSVSATAILTAKIPNTKYQILRGTEAARVQFELSLPCANIGHDTLVFQSALCDAFLFARKRNVKVCVEATDEEAIVPAFSVFVEDDEDEDDEDDDPRKKGQDDDSEPGLSQLPTPNPPTPQPFMNAAGVMRGASPKPEYHTTLPNATYQQ
ncbi:UNVERIFIED_CONTAM: hypothetical protein HDU68_008880 [Siphonaria sp. JEL0065]|nr:hypothetical protein HDU68_008880 [Siphonaria sp. JEL0065]